MAIRVTCPACDALHTVDDDKRGKKIRCRKCDEPISVPASSKKKRDDEAVQTERKIKVSASSRHDDDAAAPTPKKSSGKSALPMIVLLGGIVAIALLVIVPMASIGGYFLLRRNADEPPPLVENDAQKNNVPNPDAGKALPGQLSLERVNHDKHATAYLRVTMPNGQVSEGSGFFAFEPGIVITNAHVLGMLPSSSQPPRDVEVVVNSGEPNERRLRGTVLGVVRANDLAVLRVPAADSPPPLRVETERELALTQRVYVAGFPLGAGFARNVTLTESSVTRLGKDQTGAVEQIQVNAGMVPGNSGGPVVDTFGNVVGVSVSIIRGTQLNFAVPAEKVRLLMEGQLAESQQGEVYQQGALAKLPVKLSCIDPLNRIHELKVEVWSGVPGPPRPHGFQQPAPQAGDGPRNVFTVAYRNGVGTVDVPLPRVGPGQVCWVQPVLRTATGTHWAPASATPMDLEPVQRRPANLMVSLTAQKERTVKMSSNFTITRQFGKKQFVDSETARAELLEVILPAVKDGQNMARIRTAYADLDIAMQSDGKPLIIPDHQRGLGVVRTMPPVFWVDHTNTTTGYVGVSLNEGNPLRELVDEFNGMMHNPFEATTFRMPNRVVQPMENFPSKSSMMMRSGGVKKPGDKRQATIVDLMFNCTFEGVRVKGGREEAVITVVGNMQGRLQMAGKVQGQITGKIGFDIAGGFVSFAKLKIIADRDEDIPGIGLLQQSMLQNIEVERLPGNMRGLALAPEKGPGPGPDPIPTGPGKMLRNLSATLTDKDPFDPAAKGVMTHMKAYPTQMQAGRTYIISMNSTAFDTYLRLENPSGQPVAQDDDAGGNLNARIVYRAPQTGIYRIIATSYNANATGPFQLIVQEADSKNK
jgi:S1-C subfamily serine protease